MTTPTIFAVDTMTRVAAKLRIHRFYAIAKLSENIHMSQVYFSVISLNIHCLKIVILFQTG